MTRTKAAVLGGAGIAVGAVLLFALLGFLGSLACCVVRNDSASAIDSVRVSAFDAEKTCRNLKAGATQRLCVEPGREVVGSIRVSLFVADWDTTLVLSSACHEIAFVSTSRIELTEVP
jgi:hypothetical protein